MAWLETAKIIIQLLPLIIQIIDALEDAFPSKGQGSVKLAALKSIVESVYSSANSVTASFDQIWPMLQGTVSALVSAKNAISKV